MDKLDLTSSDLTARNVDAIYKLFPSVVTETRDDDGTVRRVIDFDLLRQELSDHVVEGPQERYGLTWPGKRAALLAANAPIRKTLRPVREESVDFDTTKNIFVEGDNLEALKLLQESYLGKVKLIYIDPPYNTGNDFIYNDDFAETTAEYLARSGQTDRSGARLVANPESNGRFHSDWLSMMYPRLKLARSLLRDDGVILVSIDRHEHNRLTSLMEQIFGESNVIANFVWVSNLKGRQISDGGPAGTHEYIVCASRSADAISQFRTSGRRLRELMPVVYRGTERVVKYDEIGSYVTKNQLYNTNSKFNEKTAPTMVFDIHFNAETLDVQVSDTAEQKVLVGYTTARPHRNARSDASWHAWRWSRTKVVRDKADLEFDVSGDELRIWTKIRDVDGMTLKDLIVGPSTVSGQADLDEMGLGRSFDTPKPVALIQTLIESATTGDDLILDFFSGSASSAHATMKANLTDGQRRQFIAVQLAENCPAGTEAYAQNFDNIAQLGQERIRRSAQLLSQSGALHDAGVRSLRVDSSNLVDVLGTPGETNQDQLDMLTDSVKPDRTGEDLLFQVLLDWGLELSVPIARKTIDNREVFVVDDGALIACFAENVSPAVVAEIARRQPLRAVFRDSGFDTDAQRINAEQVFTQVSPATDVKTI